MHCLWNRGTVIAGAMASFGLSLGCGSADRGLFNDPGSGALPIVDSSTAGGDTSGDDTSLTPPSDSSITPPIDTGVTPPTDTAVPPPVDTGTTAPLDGICAKIASATCTSGLEVCCTKHGLPYDHGNCTSNVTTVCDAAVAEVKAGTRTYDASKADECLSALRSLYSTCSVPLLTFIKAYPPCNQLLNGSTPLGGSCTNDAECHAAPGALANCGAGGRCENLSVVGKGAPCAFGGSTPALCDTGLYCSTPGSGAPGTCKTAKGIGSTCGGSFDTACGFGNSCNGRICAPGLPQGSSCSSNLECASWSCPSGSCGDPNVEMASTDVCGG